jgi:hypothetical protein
VCGVCAHCRIAVLRAVGALGALQNTLRACGVCSARRAPLRAPRISDSPCDLRTTLSSHIPARTQEAPCLRTPQRPPERCPSAPSHPNPRIGRKRARIGPQHRRRQVLPVPRSRATQAVPTALPNDRPNGRARNTHRKAKHARTPPYAGANRSPKTPATPDDLADGVLVDLPMDL